jgi:hypothetical protein
MSVFAHARMPSRDWATEWLTSEPLGRTEGVRRGATPATEL